MVQFTNNNYYHAMDRFGDDFIEPLIGEDEKAVDEALSLGTADLGLTTNPFGNAIVSVKERIMQGAGKLEFEFIGQNKGNSQQPTPESYGTKERQDIRELLTINDIKASVHASVHSQSLAGFSVNHRGFSGQQREAALKEINRAIDFAGDVTQGGAVVFHASEWQRPLTHAGQDPTARDGNFMFKGYQEEDKDAQMLVVDKRTGQFIENVSKNIEVYEPVYETVKDKKPQLIGKELNGRTVRADDYVGINGEIIDKNTTQDQELFNRIPKWETKTTHFKIEKRTWKDFEKMAQEWNEVNPNDKRTPEEYFARVKTENRVLQARGSSLYHAKEYETIEKTYKQLQAAYERAKKIEEATPEKERWKLTKQEPLRGLFPEYMIPENELPTKFFGEQLNHAKNQMKHIHESSAAADAQAAEALALLENIQSAENYGLEKTAETIAQVGMTALETSRRKNLATPLYAAPENYDQHMFGSHPAEMRKIIETSRAEMAKRLIDQGYAHNQQEAKKLSEQHIKATFDIGHMNMWRQHFNPVGKDGKPLYTSVEERHKAFDKWVLDESEKLVKDGIIGHIHLSDNMGFDDEHISPGQGNAPMKEFLRRLDKHGMRDIIVEPGSYNLHTAHQDAMSLIGSPIYGVGRAPRFNQINNRHFGYNAPPFFTGGPYSPSQDWRPWSELPLE